MMFSKAVSAQPADNRTQQPRMLSNVTLNLKWLMGIGFRKNNAKANMATHELETPLDSELKTASLKFLL